MKLSVTLKRDETGMIVTEFPFPGASHRRDRDQERGYRSRGYLRGSPDYCEIANMSKCGGLIRTARPPR